MRNLSAYSFLLIGFLIGGCGPGSEQHAGDDRVQAFVGASIFDGTGNAYINDGVVLVRNGRIEAAEPGKDVPIPGNAEQIDVSGRFIIPGLINTHGHVGDTQGLEGGHYSTENILRQLRLYARYGVTTVNSLGGDRIEAIHVRDSQNSPDLDRARLFVAGSVVAGDSPEEIRKIVDENSAQGVNFIKIRVDDFLGSQAKMSRREYRSAIDQANKNGLPVAAHLFYLSDAMSLARSGVSFIAHSVRDEVADKQLIEYLKEYDVSYCPTLTRELSTFVYEDVPDFFEDPFFLKEADPKVVDQLKDPNRQREIRRAPSTARYKEALKIASQNLKILTDAGVRIAFGTDSGPPARFQGYFEHLELDLMAKAGLSPKQILLAATRDAAASLFLYDIGTLEPDKWADFIVLREDPLVDIKNSRSIESVWIAGNRVPE